MRHGRAEMPEISSENPVKRDRSRILIMDDEKSIRTMLTHMLNAFGHDVTTAAEGNEVVDLYRRALEDQRPFHVVMLDLSVTKGMNGLETIARLRHMDPQVKAIVCSASLCGQTEYYQQYGFRGVLPKPFTSQGLLQTITTVLTAAPPR